MAEHLEVLGDMPGGRVGIVEALREADTLDGRLRDTLDDCWRLNAQHVQHRRHHIDDVSVLRADLALRLDAFRPVHDERVAGATAIGLALPATERGIACKGPAPGIVVEGLRPAQLIQLRQALLQRLLRVVEELPLVGGASRAALGTGAVVGDDHDQRVVELAGALQVVEQATNVIVGVTQKAGKDLHHARVEPFLLWGERLPLWHVRVVTREFGALRDDAQRFLPGEDFFAVGIPAVVEHALVLIRPLLGHVMRRVRGAGAEMQVKRLVGCDLPGIGDELDGLVDQVLGQVVALLGRLGRLDLVVVVDQVRVVLVGIAAQEAVVALETASQGPAVVGTGGGFQLRWDQVVLADHVGVVALGQQHLREEAILERDIAVIAGVAGGEFRDAGHAIGVVVASGENAGTRGRAERSGVHVGIAQPTLGQAVQVGCLDGAAVAAELAVAGVIQHDK